MKKRAAPIKRSTPNKRSAPIKRSAPVIPWLAAGPAVVASLAGYFLLRSRHAWAGFPLDDAWIHRVYARAMASGSGFAYNTDGEQVTGVTSPLWALISAPAHWLEPLGETVPIIAVKLLGIAAACLAAWMVGRIAATLGASRLTGAIAGVLFALSPRLHFAALSGMEDVLLATLWITAVERALTHRWTTAAALFGLAAVTRPEAAVLICLLPLAIWIHAERPRGVLLAPVTWLALFAPAALWALFCLWVTGHPLPATFYVKAADPTINPAALGALFQVITTASYAGLWAFPLGLGAFALWGARARQPRPWWSAALLLSAAALLYLLGVGSTRSLRPDGYYWLRYTDAALLVLNVTFVIGAALSAHHVLTLLGSPRTRGRLKPSWISRGVALAAVVTTASVLASLPALSARITERRDRLSSDSRVIDRMNVALGKWVAEHTPTTARVGVNDAGAIRYFGNRHTLDIIGLNDTAIAFGRSTPLNRARELGLSYLIGFPQDLNRLMKPILPDYEVLRTFAVSPAEYTVCQCRGQTLQVVLARN